MHISWHGYNTIKIQTPDLSLVIDPYAPSLGLSPFRGKADYLLLSNAADETMSYTKSIQGDFQTIDQPGEYSFEKISLYAQGWMNQKTSTEQIIFRLHIDDIVILCLGALNRKLNQPELQELEQSNIDILFVPIGGFTTINTAQALDLVTTIEPNIVIPTNYLLPKATVKLDSVDSFAKEMGVNPKKTEKKLLISANKIDHDNIATIILSP